jgi:hypothetical protein
VVGEGLPDDRYPLSQRGSNACTINTYARLSICLCISVCLCLLIYLFIYSSYSLATVRLWRRLHILITKLVLQLLPQVPTGIRPRAVIRFGGVVPRCYPCVCSISCLLFPVPCLLGGHLAGLSSISSSLPLPFLVLFPAFVSSTVHNSI